jgi:hypothetical protein
MNAIKISIIRTSKPFAGRIIGTNEKYGFELEFSREIERKSSKHHIITVSTPGVYRISEDATIGNRGISSGFIRLSEDGAVEEITKEQAIASLESK